MIVIGGSLGGCEALREILIRLPSTFPLPIAVVLHRHRDSDGILLSVVQSSSALPVVEVEDKDQIKGGHVYLCPPDYHLLIDNGYFALSTDEAVSFARPSIDVMFESAAEWLGRRVIAVVLTGSGSDGAKGARCVEAHGGTVLIQDPKTADGLWMPTAAIATTKTARVLTLGQIAAELISLSTRPLPSAPATGHNGAQTPPT
jgi:two-component system chemotaxis response regulator CheB